MLSEISVVVSSVVNKIVSFFERKGQNSIVCWRISNRKGVSRIWIIKLPWKSCLSGSLEPIEPFEVIGASLTLTLIMVEKSPFVFKFAMVRQILIVEEDGFVLNKIDSLGPAHGIRIIVSWYLFFLHVVNDIHVHFPCSHKVDHSASSGQIAPSVGVQLYPQSILIVFGQNLSQLLRLVFVVVGGHLADHDMLLVGSHVQVVDAHSPGH